ncbi:MAG TPA: signal peptidase I [Flavobacteriales bacterium]|nr:signal peptidase I [Flavobacteriales bacterium]
MDYKWIINILLLVLLFIGLSKIFTKAGRQAWEAFVPGYNFWVWLRIIDKPWWWLILLLIPGVNLMMVLIMVFLTMRNFEVESPIEIVGGIIFFPFYLIYLGFGDKYRFMGADYWKKYERTKAVEWSEAIVFAVVVATIVRTFFFEAFTIPTSSMEKTLLVGDFLFVSKVSYGAKTPNTPLTIPFTHHTMPFTETVPSYSEWIELPYFRFPGFGKVQNNDIVVFNYPDGDTVSLNMQNISYYRLVRSLGWENVNSPEKINPYNGKPFGKVAARPVDKRDNYVKRCVAIAGDKLEIKNKQLYVNDQKAQNPEMMQFSYDVQFNTMDTPKKLFDKLDITDAEKYNNIANANLWQIHLNNGNKAKLQNSPNLVQLGERMDPAGMYDPDIFPNAPSYSWNKDNYGPLVIPKAGVQVAIDTHSIHLYKRIISVYEGNDLKINGNQILINGAPATSYTFKQDYYFMMGDNRHNSADSRFWGFVPHDHIVGKAVFIWLSRSTNRSFPNIRTERVFSFIRNDGVSSSYFLHIMIPLVLLILGWNNRNRFRTQH